MTFSAPIMPPMRQAHRVADRARGDDRALAGHQPRDRGDRADAAGLVSVMFAPLRSSADSVFSRALVDQRVEGGQELGEACGRRRG